jgi:hypothetical protein
VHLDGQAEDEEPDAQQCEHDVRDGQHAAHDNRHCDDAHDAVHGGQHQHEADYTQRAHYSHAVLQGVHCVAVSRTARVLAQRSQYIGAPVMLDPRLERRLQEEGGVAGHEQPSGQHEVGEEEEQQQAALVPPGAHEAQHGQQNHAAAQSRERRRAGPKVGAEHEVQR